MTETLVIDSIIFLSKYESAPHPKLKVRLTLPVRPPQDGYGYLQIWLYEKEKLQDETTTLILNYRWHNSSTGVMPAHSITNEINKLSFDERDLWKINFHVERMIKEILRFYREKYL